MSEADEPISELRVDAAVAQAVKNERERIAKLIEFAAGFSSSFRVIHALTGVAKLIREGKTMQELC